MFKYACHWTRGPPPPGHGVPDYVCVIVDMPSPGSYIHKLQERMHLAHRIAHEHLQNAMRCSKEIDDFNMQQFNYKAGDAVWCLHKTNKVERAFDGPFLS
ncbi:hypothetical protein DPMN_135173 [Dreissena polymorpha]|uniref:Uncharacterized protein n=1 Tax=Dreissena polymorpha TaxID=45954 RepID=A0A9D4FXJ3_DREPO|nr:hypothetical protein DPMN_135173 [Dreissena polymorpha]